MTDVGWFWLIAGVFLVLLALLAVRAWLWQLWLQSKQPASQNSTHYNSHISGNANQNNTNKSKTNKNNTNKSKTSHRNYRSLANTQLLAENIALFEQRLAELATDFAKNDITQADYIRQKTQLERQLLAASDDLHNSQHQFSIGVLPVLLVVLAIPAFTLLAYYQIADRGAVVALWQANADNKQLAKDLLTGKQTELPARFFTTRQSTEQSQPVTQLLQTMQYQVYRHADQPNYWQNLAALYSTLAMPESSLVALAQAYHTAPNDSSIAMHYVQQRFFAEGELTPQSKHIIQKVLSAQPAHEGAYMLLIMNELKAQHYQQAQLWVTKLKQILQHKGDDRKTALASLEALTSVLDEKLQSSEE